MEGERSFESRRSESLSESSRRLNDIQREYLQTPEDRKELMGFFEYLRALREFVRENYSPTQQEVMFRRLHLEVTAPQFAAAIGARTITRGLPTPRTLPIGDHMDVTVGLTAEYQWPDRSKHTLSLTDGFIVHPQTPVGIIDFYRNITRLGQSGNLIELSRALISSANQSLTMLAQGYERLRVGEGIEAPHVEGFSGMSHLARLAQRFGFTVFDITDEARKRRATQASFNIASGVASGNEVWEALKNKYKPAQIAIISGRELVRKFNQ